jgi:outer membrane protein TolC
VIAVASILCARPAVGQTARTDPVAESPPIPLPRPFQALNADESRPAPPPLRAATLDTSLIPGRSIEPIDLANALRLAGARDLDIALARQRVNQAFADLEFAYAQWLPSLFIGPTWYRADGQVQTITGQVETVNRNSLFIGALAATTAPGYAAASPGTGFMPLNGSSAVFRFSDAIYGPIAARRVVAAGHAGVQTAINDAMLAVAEAYFDLQYASGRLAIAREAAANAQTLSEITGSFARTGEGLQADHHRALTELRHRKYEIHLATGQFLVASANLIRILVLDPHKVIAPAEPSELVIRLIPDDVPLDDLVVKGLQHRPELAGAQELVQATIARLKQAKLRPFVPSLAVSYAGGGFGGGQGSFFGNFGARGDVAASLFWELQNLGFGDRAIIQRRAFERNAAELEKVKVEARVAAEVVAAFDTRTAASLQIKESRATVVEALDSLKLNVIHMREGAELPRANRPIEVLQPIQALAQARTDYLESVLTYNRAQFRLNRAIGCP